MARLVRFFALALLPLLAAAPAPAEDSPFSAAEEEAIGRLVKQYLLEHPEVILEAIQELERRKQAEASAKQKDALEANYELLVRDPDSPVVGNPDGDVVVVEFFDYNCGYCRKMAQDVFALVERDGDIRYVLKELPIFGEGSTFAARAALAAQQQDKYSEFHYALMTSAGKIDKTAALAIAAEVGLDLDRLQQDMLDPAISKQLERNFTLAHALGVEGTPATVVGRRFVSGARTYDELAALVAAERQAVD